MFYTYIIYSNKADKFYIGATENLEQRLAKHRNKNKGFTNQADDWQIVYSKEFQTKSEALAYERQIKSWKSKKKIISLIESQ
jgi:putative endonuclease